VHATFADLGRHLRAGDLLVVNNSRVFPARLLGVRDPSGGAAECFLLRRLDADPSGREEWSALVHPGQKLKPGARVRFERDGVRIDGEILAMHFDGRRTIRLTTEAGTVSDAIERVGHVPLPPYVKREDEASDRDRYQTIYARDRGSIAAPTAGLHFTGTQVAGLQALGVEWAELTLHVGYGTFKPVKVSRVEDHVVEPEHYAVPETTAEALTRARRDGRRIVAVGTTTVRTLESLTVEPGGRVRPGSGETQIFIYPGHRFQLVDGLVTNFHLPRSSLLMLVSALGGRELVLAAYREAIAQGYQFYSYGDAMLLV
jgi:S-adenosylmethionine:tRNA ribosyltransferase-isomerase